MEITKIAVIGSGVMGASIAAHIANAGYQVLLLDIVPKDSENRNILGNNAKEKLLKIGALTIEENLEKITIGNLEDDLEQLKHIDWIIEAIIEDLDIKQALYKKINLHRKPQSIISSNTSTLKISSLISNMDEEFKQDFMITHFFNPPRYMQLLELIYSDQTSQKNKLIIEEFIDNKIGKNIVECKDTPGFIANRIGCYWLKTGLNIALKRGIEINIADSIISKHFGIPSTAIFGLWDLIGIDTMKLLSESLKTSLEELDEFNQDNFDDEFISWMLENKLIGRKGNQGGFYRINKVDNKKIKEILNLKDKKHSLLADDDYYKNLSFDEIISSDDQICLYAQELMTKTLAYCVNHAEEISNNILNIDLAMKWGYSWKYGPFELIDKIGISNFKLLLQKFNLKMPKLFEQNKFEAFYSDNKFIDFKGEYQNINLNSKKINLNEMPILIENNAACLKDVGDNILCFELRAKLGILKYDVFKLLDQALDYLNNNKYKGMIIANNGNNFCAGGDLEFMHKLINEKKYNDLENYIKYGQKIVMKIKSSHYPIIAAHNGFAVGGGMEILLHCHHIISHVESKIGLVETRVGLIPAWGGIKEFYFQICNQQNCDLIKSGFKSIITGNIIDPAHRFKNNFVLKNHTIIMNYSNIISVAKAKIIELSNSKQQHKEIYLNNELSADKKIMLEELILNQDDFSKYDQYLAFKIFSILTSKYSKDQIEQELLENERRCFMEIVKNKETEDRIAFMLANQKALKN